MNVAVITLNPTVRNILTDNTELIRRRALQYVSTLDFVAPNIVDVREADANIVAQLGSGSASAYRTSRIEMRYPEDLEDLFDVPSTIDVTCSATDVIRADFPFIDILDSIQSPPKLSESVSVSNVTPEMHERYEPIRRRALAYVESTNWVEPVITHEQEPHLFIVDSRGSGDLTAYRDFRIEMWKPENERDKVLSAPPDAPKTARYLDAPKTLDIICSTTDVIGAFLYDL